MSNVNVREILYTFVYNVLQKKKSISFWAVRNHGKYCRLLILVWRGHCLRLSSLCRSDKNPPSYAWVSLPGAFLLLYAFLTRVSREWGVKAGLQHQPLILRNTGGDKPLLLLVIFRACLETFSKFLEYKTHKRPSLNESSWNREISA